jgi:raffinose/stachyose/melibiose transport system substrate-binding protein
VDDVKKLQAAGITPIALGDKDKWPGHFWWVYLALRQGGKDGFVNAVNRTGKFTDPPFIEAGKKLQQLNETNPFPDGFLGLTFNEHSAFMASGKAGFELMGQWTIDNQKNTTEDKKGLGDKWHSPPSQRWMTARATRVTCSVEPTALRLARMRHPRRLTF